MRTEHFDFPVFFLFNSISHLNSLNQLYKNLNNNSFRVFPLPPSYIPLPHFLLFSKTSELKLFPIRSSDLGSSSVSLMQVWSWDNIYSALKFRFEWVCLLLLPLVVHHIAAFDNCHSRVVYETDWFLTAHSWVHSWLTALYGVVHFSLFCACNKKYYFLTLSHS